MKNYDLNYGLPLNENGEFDCERIFGCDPDDRFYIRRPSPRPQWDTPIPNEEIERYLRHGIARIPLSRINPRDLWQGRVDLTPLAEVEAPVKFWKRDRSILYRGRQKIREIPARIYVASLKANSANTPQGRVFSSHNREIESIWFELGIHDGLSFWKLNLFPSYRPN